jgi:hypothetical protein
MIDLPGAFAWPAPWAPLGDEKQRLGLPAVRNEVFGGEPVASSIVEELRREVCSDHPLAGHRCVPVAYNREDENEFVFLTSNPELLVAVVHLTWKQEASPKWPWTYGFRSLEEFKASVEQSTT